MADLDKVNEVNETATIDESKVENKVTISVTISPDVKAKLDAKAKKEKRSRSNVIEIAVDDYLKITETATDEQLKNA